MCSHLITRIGYQSRPLEASSDTCRTGRRSGRGRRRRTDERVAEARPLLPLKHERRPRRASKQNGSPNLRIDCSIAHAVLHRARLRNRFCQRRDCRRADPRRCARCPARIGAPSLPPATGKALFRPAQARLAHVAGIAAPRRFPSGILRLARLARPINRT